MSLICGNNSVFGDLDGSSVYLITALKSRLFEFFSCALALIFYSDSIENRTQVPIVELVKNIHRNSTSLFT